jgi:hypothetical protein
MLTLSKTITIVKTTSRLESFEELADKIDEARRQAFQQFVTIGEALFKLQDQRFYGTWKRDPKLKTLPPEERNKIVIQDDYYRWRWQYSRGSIWRFIQAYQVVKTLHENLSPIGDKNVPSSEGAARPLTKFLDNVPKLLNIWSKAVELAKSEEKVAKDEEKVTSRHVLLAIEDVQKEAKAEMSAKADSIIKQKEKLKAEEEEMRMQREKDIIEISTEDIENDPDFDSKVEPTTSDEEFEDMVKEMVEEKEKELRKNREDELLQEVPENRLVGLASKQWNLAIKHFYKYDRKRIAKIYIKMLFKKYPELMDEVI